MNYVDKANWLRQQRLSKEVAEQSKAELTADEKAKIDRERIVALFNEMNVFDGYEIEGGLLHVYIYEFPQVDKNAHFVNVSIGTPFLKDNRLLFYANCISDRYHLYDRRHSIYVGNYSTIEELMEQLAIEVSKL